MITENILLDNFDPAFRSLNSTHLDSGKGIVQLLSNRTHCLHTAWKQISFPWSTILPTGEITAAVPHRPHSANSGTSSKKTSLSSTSIPRYFSATYSRERRVIEGRILLDFGVTSLLSLVMKIKLARRFLLLLFWWQRPDTCFHQSPGCERLRLHEGSWHSLVRL